MLSNFMMGFEHILTFEIIAMVVLGTILGNIFGSIPGITTGMGIALVLPITFGMTIVPAIALIVGMYVGGTTAGFIPAILLNIPGTPGSLATIFDGYPMAQRGEAGKAIGISILSSFIGGMLSLVVLFTLAPVLARFALRFGPIEYFSIVVLTFVLIASLSGNSLIKGMISALLGVILTTIGMSPIDGAFRYTFGIHMLIGGIHLLPVLIGVYALTEVLKIAEFDSPLAKPGEYKMKGFGLSWGEAKSQIFNWLRSATVGIGVGILPGIGANVSNIISYTAAKNQSKYPEKFGTGIIDGVIASETSNNGVTGSAMIPVLTMGIPADVGTAMLMAAMMIHGVQPGPLLFTNNPLLVYSIFALLIISNFVMISSLYFGMRLFVKVLLVPKYILMPIILVICCVGAFSIAHRLFDVGSLVAIALLAYGMIKFDYPLAPLVLGFVLGDLFEVNLRRGLQVTRGNFLGFFESPIALVVFIIFGIVVFLEVRKQLKLRRKPSSNQNTGEGQNESK